MMPRTRTDECGRAISTGLEVISSYHGVVSRPPQGTGSEESGLLVEYEHRQQRGARFEYTFAPHVPGIQPSNRRS